MAAARCTAMAKSTGARCTQPAIAGGTVCRFHGGSAPQVKAAAADRLAAARERLLEELDPSISRLLELRDGEDKQVAVRAVLGVLDRAGLSVALKAEVTHYEGDADFEQRLAERLAEKREHMAEGKSRVARARKT